MLAITGAMGVAGGFLYRLLVQNGYGKKDIDCYDIKRPERCGIKSCAFGVAKKPFVNLLKLANLDAQKYVLKEFDEIDIDNDLHCKAGLCTIDKPKLLKDLVGDKKIKILENGERIDTDKYDLVVDSTGYKRTYLPSIKDDLIIPTVQYRIKTEEYLPLKVNLEGIGYGIGYGWIFPLGNNEYHIGIGCFKCNLTEQFQEIYGEIIKKSEIICGCTSFIRLLTPRYAIPIVSGNIVGCGESIGTVSPACGAGIISSMEAAQLLAKNIDNIPKYEKEVVKKFSYLDVEVEAVRKVLNGGKLSIRDSMKLLANAKKAGVFIVDHYQGAKVLLQLLKRGC